MKVRWGPSDSKLHIFGSPRYAPGQYMPFALWNEMRLEAGPLRRYTKYTLSTPTCDPGHSTFGSAVTSPMQWTEMINVAAGQSDGGLTSTGANSKWDSGAISSRQIYFSETAQSVSFKTKGAYGPYPTGTLWIQAGLSHSSNSFAGSANYPRMCRCQFGFYLQHDNVGIIELDYNHGQDANDATGKKALWKLPRHNLEFGTRTDNDVMAVRVTGYKVEYLKNNVVIYTSKHVPTFPLSFDAALIYNSESHRMEFTEVTLSAVDPNAAAVCGACPVGTYSADGGPCTPCPAGTSTNAQVGQSACTKFVHHAISVALAGNRCSATPALDIIPKESMHQNGYSGSKENATFTGRYLRIGDLPSNEPLHLQEIEVFDASGQLLKPKSATLSSEHANTLFPARKCIDGDHFQETRAPKSMCCSAWGDTNPWIRVDYGTAVPMAKIVITNRFDCCDHRIAGATVAITQDADGDQVVWAGILQGTKEQYTYMTDSDSVAFAPSPEACAALVAGDGGCASNTATFQYNAASGACQCVPQDCPRLDKGKIVDSNSLDEDAGWTIYNRFDLTATPSKRYHFEHTTPTARVGAAGAWVAAEGYGERDGKTAAVAEPPLSATEVSEWTMKILSTPAGLGYTEHNWAFNIIHFGIFVGKDLPITDMNTRKRQEDAKNTDCMYGKSYPLCQSYLWDGSYMFYENWDLIVGNGNVATSKYEYWELPYRMEALGTREDSARRKTPMYQTGDEVRFRFDPAAGHCSIVVVRGNVTYFAGAFMLKAEHVGKPVRITMHVKNVGKDGNNGAVMITDTPKAPPCDPSHPNAKGTAACNAISVALAGKRCKDSIAAVTGSTGSAALAASPEECAALVAGDGGCAGNTATFQYNAVSGACHCLPQGCYPSQVVDSENVCTDLSAKYQCPPHRNDWSIYNRFDVTAVPSHTYSFKHKTPSALLGAGGAWASGIGNYPTTKEGSVTLIAEPALPIAEVSEWAIKLLYSPADQQWTAGKNVWAFGIFVGDELPVKPSMNLLKRDPDTEQPSCSYGDDYPNCQSYNWDGTYLLYRDGDVLFGDGKFECSDKRGCYSYLYNDGTLGPPNEAKMYSPFIMESQGNTFSNRAKPAYLTGDEIRFRFDPTIGRCTMLVLRGDDTFNAGAFTLKPEHLGKPVRIHVFGDNVGKYGKTGAVMIADVAPPTVADIPNNAGVKPVVGLLARVGSATKADSAFWEAECQRLPPTTQYIIVMMGAVFDYFKPIDGETSFCDMLTSNDKHLWSPNGVDWQQPTYANAAQGSGKVLGGSSDAWPRVNVGNDERDLLSMWGYMDGAERGGCCSRSKKVASTTGHNGGTDAWAQDFDMWYVDLKTSTTSQILPQPSTCSIYVGGGDNHLYSIVPHSGDTVWSTDLGPNRIAQSTAVLSADDSVVYFGSDNKKLVALRTSDGTELWNLSTKNIESKPALSPDGSKVYVRGGNTLYAASTSNGQPLWTVDAKSSPLLLEDGTLLYMAGARLFAVNSDTGKQLWVSEELADGNSGSIPTLNPADGLVYLRMFSSVVALSADVAGVTHKWTTELPKVTNENGKVISATLWGAQSADFSRDGDILYLGGLDKTLRAVHTTNGTVMWAFKAKSAVYEPAVDHDSGAIIVGAMNCTTSYTWCSLTEVGGHHVYAVNPDGSFKWGWDHTMDDSFVTDAPSFCADNIEPHGTRITMKPLIAFGTVYFGDAAGYFHAISAETGDTIWKQ